MAKELQKRGQLTPRIKKASKKLLGREITQEELRLIPYLGYVLQNEQRINRSRVRPEEEEILTEWEAEGYIYYSGKGLNAKLRCTPEFWEAMAKIIYLGYVDISD